MITLERPAFCENDRYAEYCGLSTDDLSSIDANNGDEFYEIDTGNLYKYDESVSGWIVRPKSGGGSGTGGVESVNGQTGAVVIETGDFKADGSVEMTGNLHMGAHAIMGVKSISDAETGLAIESEVSMNNHKITDILDPTEEQDAVTKSYLDNVVSALNTVISSINTNMTNMQQTVADIQKRIDDLTTETA